jgi:hypothetical protein
MNYNMKAILEFNLPDEQSDFDNAVDGYKWSLVAWELDQHLRSQLKYNDELTEEQHDTCQEIRDKLWDILGDKNLSFDS